MVKFKNGLGCLYGISLALGVMACGIAHADDRITTAKAQGANTVLSPTHDFYRWVNHDWLDNTPIPADKPGVNNFLAIQQQVNRDIEQILTSLKQKQTKSAAEQKIAMLHEAFLDMPTRNAQGLKPLLVDMAQIERAKTHRDIALLFATLQKKGVAPPLLYVVSTDFKHSDRNIVVVTQAGLGIERDSYIGTDARAQKQRLDYQEYVQQLLTLAELPHAAARAKAVLALENALALAQWSHAENRDYAKIYNVMDFAAVKAKLSQFNLDDQMQELGMPTDYPFDVEQPSYVVALNQLLLQYDVQTWQSYLLAHLLEAYAPLLNQDFKTAYVQYQIQQGLIEQEEPMSREAINYLNKNVGMLMGKAYVENVFDEKVKIKLNEIIQHMTDEYRVAIQASPRMAASTKAKALQKLDNMRFKIGYPDTWQDYSALDVQKGELVANHQRISLYEHKRNISKLGQPVNKSEWEHPPQDVNAFYDPSSNSFVLLAGILYSPFFNKNGSDAEHYGGIGFVIGHEIGHGFDDQGSQFDGDGNLVNWWTPEDLTAFNQVKNALIDQANHYEILPGRFLKGELEIGEIMGDLSGAEISLRAFQKIVQSKHLNAEDAYRDYFKQLAITWRDKLRPDFQLYVLDADPHPASEFRANGIVKNMNEFHQVYQTKPGDAMYLSPSQRIKIW
jgi:putative endopeptidase